MQIRNTNYKTSLIHTTPLTHLQKEILQALEVDI